LDGWVFDGLLIIGKGWKSEKKNWWKFSSFRIIENLKKNTCLPGLGFLMRAYFFSVKVPHFITLSHSLDSK
jgi:hypothetical protein